MGKQLFCAMFVCAAVACGGTAGPAETTEAAPARDDRDIHSFARPNEVRVTHVALDLRADFDRRVLTGTATLDLTRNGSANQVVLDTRGLDIQQITAPDASVLKFELGAVNGSLGQPLTIDLPSGVSRVVIAYETRPDAEALQWLEPPQTAGRKQPYLFSQGQAILTRTWIPTQDSPAVRQTYSARITVPRGLRAVMSAEQLTPEGESTDAGTRFEFRMNEAIPPYLIAIAAGDIAFRPLGPRTGVYAEPPVLDAAAREFVDLEAMLSVGEKLLGPYRWGRYDVLVLPPSFPYGGMENPRLTFATPTIIAGDRSLVALIAHELAHSWSGNLVTNATWRDFWLNEGMTTYLEKRLMEAIYGKERADMLQVLSRRELDAELERLGNGGDTVLHVDLTGRSPDDAFSGIPYDKGSALLHLIEATVGRERFDVFLRGYFERNAFQSMTTAQFVDELREHLFRGDTAIEQTLQLDEWLYEPGLPQNVLTPQSTALARVEQQTQAFATGTPASGLDSTGSWSTQEWQHFLNTLPSSLTRAQLADLDRTFKLSARGNSEVLFSWLMLAVRHQYEPALAPLERFVTSHGRRKFLRPLYEELMKTEWGRDDARRIYARARPLYHSVSTGTLDAIVK